jgi:hypothetical protein
MSMPLLAATADHGKLGNKNYLLACNVNALVAATANCKLRKVKIIGSPAVMSTPSLVVTADGAQGHRNYLLAFDVYALVAATTNGKLENKNYSLAGDVCAFLGRDRHSACRFN